MTQTDEEWRPIPGWEGYYEASDQGRIRSVDRVVYAARGRYQMRLSGTVLAQQTHGTQEPRYIVKLWRDGRKSTQRIAPLILAAFIGPRPRGAEACHNNGDATDDRLSNLRWDTPSANNHDSVRHGVHPMARKTHCKRGHALRAPNLHKPTGPRLCLACRRTNEDAASARRAGRPMFDFDERAAERYAVIMASETVGA